MIEIGSQCPDLHIRHPGVYTSVVKRVVVVESLASLAAGGLG